MQVPGLRAPAKRRDRHSQVPDARGQEPVRGARVGGDIRAPRKARSVNPEYPADARRAGLAVVVVLECTLDPRGEVGDMVVLRGAPPLTESAKKAVKQWRYEPTLLDGVPGPVIMTVTVNFKLDGVPVRYHGLLGSLDHANEHIRVVGTVGAVVWQRLKVSDADTDEIASRDAHGAAPVIALRIQARF